MRIEGISYLFWFVFVAKLTDEFKAKTHHFYGETLCCRIRLTRN